MEKNINKRRIYAAEINERRRVRLRIQFLTGIDSITIWEKENSFFREYFRKHAMTNPNHSRDAKPDGDSEPQPDEVVDAGPETSL